MPNGVIYVTQTICIRSCDGGDLLDMGNVRLNGLSGMIEFGQHQGAHGDVVRAILPFALFAQVRIGMIKPASCTHLPGSLRSERRIIRSPGVANMARESPGRDSDYIEADGSARERGAECDKLLCCSHNARALTWKYGLERG